MGKHFGRKPKGPEVIASSDFIASAQEKLALADDATSSFNETITAARSLAGQIERIRKGKLEVRPPIALVDLDSFAQSAGTIIALGEKATQSLTQAAEVHQGAQSEAAFTGTGDLPKA